MTERIPTDADLNDFDYLAASLEAEARLGEAYGYVSVDAIKFYLGQMRRLYQQALAGHEVVQLVMPIDDADPGSGEQ